MFLHLSQEVLAGSDRSAVLYFTNFVEGVYLFNLTIYNKYNAHSTTIVNLTVLPGEERDLGSVVVYMLRCVFTVFRYSRGESGTVVLI